MARVLIVDDEVNICEALSFALEDSYEVLTANEGKEAFAILRKNEIDVVLLDLKLGEENGLDILKSIKRNYHDVEVIIITSYGTIKSSVEAIQLGAFYYIAKPLDLAELELYIKRAIQNKIAANAVKNKKSRQIVKYSLNLVGDSNPILEVKEMVNRVKDIDSNVLISGESGTGKELVARAIHTMGSRKTAILQIINCAALPASLMESELFGYEKGAFTGAQNSYPGRFRLADGGSLFLDEIGELDMGLQAKLLRVLQDRIVMPLGSTRQHEIDVRIIAATNRNLREEVEKGNFRQDLYYRLNVIEIKIPPLRERKEDIPLLTGYLLKQMSGKLRQEIKHISPAAMILLEHYNYPGNVRELENILERACAVSESNVVELSDLPAEMFEDMQTESLEDSEDGIVIHSGESLDDIEKKVILMNLANIQKPRKEIAKLLGISERTLRNKLKIYSDDINDLLS